MKMLQRSVLAIYAAAAALVPAAAFQASSQSESTLVCQPAGSMRRMATLTEASGLAVSRTMPGHLWTHNDSGKPEIVAVDAKGQVAGRVSLSGASVVDWEAMASAPCGSTTCLYVADIGDNSGKRKDITVYRVPEPTKPGGSAQVSGVLRATYPDGSHDAEALLATPDGTLYIVTKGDTGHIALYRFPRELQTGATMRLERIGSPMGKGKPAEDARITDGAVSPDGIWAVLRTRGALLFYRAAEFLKGDFREVRRADLKALGEPQGEGVAFGPSNTMYVVGEGGGKSQPGTLVALSCPR